MASPAPICTHIKTDGIRCGSPAEGGTEFCYHHSAVKTALGKVPARGVAGSGAFAPIAFVFPEDRASMQINFFLLLQAFNQGQVDLRTYRPMLSLLKEMAKNLGKTGSLVENSDQRSAVSDQKDRAQGSERRAQKGGEPTSQKRDPSASSGQAGGHPRSSDGDVAGRELVGLSAAAERRGEAAVGAFSFAPDYGSLPSVMPWMKSGSDPVREMARQAAKVRW